MDDIISNLLEMFLCGLFILVMLIIPEEKRTSRMTKILKVISVLFAIAMISILLAGIILIISSDAKSILGVSFVSISLMIMVILMIFSLIIYKK